MITEEQHPQMVLAQQDLLRRLERVIGLFPKTLTQSLLDKMRGVINDHRIEWRQKGVDFPVLVALVVPRFRIVEWKRADLDLASIRTCIVNFVRAHPQISMSDLVNAIRGAYPDLKPDDILERHESGVKAHERAEAKRNMEDGNV
jgi:hypothetical protein